LGNWLKIGVLVAICLIPLFIIPAYGISEKYVVEPNTYWEYILELKTDCIVTASFTVDGGSNDITFRLTDPNGEIVFPEQRVTNSVEEFFFKAKKDGGYTFYFLNRGIFDDKLIQLSYDKDCPKDEFGGGCLIATATFGSELKCKCLEKSEIIHYCKHNQVNPLCKDSTNSIIHFLQQLQIMKDKIQYSKKQ